MNRRLVARLLVAAIVLLLGLVVANNYTQTKTVTVRIEENAESTSSVVKNLDGKEVEDVEYNKGFRLKKGSYYIETTGQDFEPLRTDIVVDKSLSLTLSPSYTSEKLSSLLSPQLDSIQKTISDDIPEINTSYKINTGKLYITGQWYATTVQKKLTKEQERTTYIDVYRVVLGKNGGNWVVLTKPPEIILSAARYPDIPRDILVDINQNPSAVNQLR
jgi:hypothetical protein